jgi:transposase
MASAVGLRADYSAAELRRLAAMTKNASQSRRLLSLAGVLDGMNRTEAARIGGMDRQTLRDWVHRFNAHGPEGLLDSWSKGPEPRLSNEQRAEVAELVSTGPDQAIHGVVRWRRIDLQRVILERFGIGYHERTIGKLLKALGFSHISARPRHPAQDPLTIEAFKKRMARPSARGFASRADQSTPTYPASRLSPRPRWRSARPGPHKLHGIECHFLNQGSRTPVDCQAISLPPLADIIADYAW